jgi:hypothetical protein
MIVYNLKSGVYCLDTQNPKNYSVILRIICFFFLLFITNGNLNLLLRKKCWYAM